MFKFVMVTIRHDNISTSEFSKLRERLSNWVSQHRLKATESAVYQNFGYNLIALKQEGKTTTFGSDPQSLSARTLLHNINPQDYLDLFMEFKCKEKKYIDNFDFNLNPFSQSN